MQPIGHFHGPEQRSYLLPRQPGPTGVAGKIVLRPDLHQAVRDLEGFDRVWVIFLFDRAHTWKPMVLPPGEQHKRGLFATRSPHRPNPIGMSAVKLVRVESTVLYVDECDLLDATPILDLKPYIAATDSYPDATGGWTSQRKRYRVSYGCNETLDWIQENGGPNLRQAVEHSLAMAPHATHHNRVTRSGDGGVWACQTWRIHFTVDEGALHLSVDDVTSGYSEAERAGEDRWGDLALHKAFRERF